jgi:hypothetical protein
MAPNASHVLLNTKMKFCVRYKTRNSWLSAKAIAGSTSLSWGAFRTLHANFNGTFHSNSTSSLGNYDSLNGNLIFKCHTLLLVHDMQFDDAVCGFVLFLAKKYKNKILKLRFNLKKNRFNLFWKVHFYNLAQRKTSIRFSTRLSNTSLPHETYFLLTFNISFEAACFLHWKLFSLYSDVVDNEISITRYKFLRSRPTQLHKLVSNLLTTCSLKRMAPEMICYAICVPAKNEHFSSQTMSVP